MIPISLKRTIILLIGFSSFKSLGQDFFNKLSHYDNDYKQVIEEAEAYFKTRSHGKGSGWKQYQRWKWELQYHLDKDGNVISQKKEEEAEKKYIRTVEKRSKRRRSMASGNVANWIEQGPSSYQITSSWSSGMARTYDVQVSRNNPDVIYASTGGGGVWKSINGGFDWFPITDQLPLDRVFSLAIDPNDDDHVLIYIQNHGLYTTSDGGLSWTRDDYFNDFRARKITFAPGSSSTIFVGASTSLSKSTNGGTSWNSIDLPHEFNYSPSVEDILFHPTNPSIVYVSSQLRLYKSTNGGDSFSRILTNLPKEGRTRIAVTKAEPDYLYILQDYQNRFGGLYLSTDAGNTFSTQVDRNSPDALNYFSLSEFGTGTDGQAYHDMAISVSGTDASTVFIAGINIWKSTNNGQDFSINAHWHKTRSVNAGASFVHADHHQLYYLEDGTLINCNDGGVYKSTDDGNTWMDFSNGIRARQFYKIAYAETNPNILGGGSQDNGHCIKQNSGNWVDWLGADGMEVLISPKDENKAYGFVQSGLNLYKTINQGETSIYLGRPNLDDQNGAWITPLAMDSDDDEVVYAGYGDFFRRNSSGWQKIHDFSNNNHITRIETCPSNSNRMYLIKGSYLYRTDDKGITWTNLDIFCHDLSVDPNNENILVVSTGSGEISLTKDGGDTFTSISKGLNESNSIFVRCIEFDHSNKDGVYIGTANTIYYTNNELDTWIPYSTHLPKVRMDEIEVVKSTGEVLVATYGRGIWKSNGYEESDFTVRPLVSIYSTHRGNIEEGSQIHIIADAVSPEGKDIIQMVFSINGDEYIDNEKPFIHTINSVNSGELTVSVQAIDEEGIESLTETKIIDIKSGTGTCDVDSWDPNETYRTEGILVQHLGKLYRNKWWNSDREPGTEPYGPWTFVEDCGSDGVENLKPTSSFTSPSDSQVFPEMSTVSLEAIASDSDNNIFAMYIILNNENYISYSSSHSVDFTPEVAGTYTALLISQDEKGSQSDVSEVTFTVGDASNIKPTVTLTSPANGQEVKDVTVVTLTADASDEDGTVSAVEFTVNGEVILDDSAPFEIVWTPTVGGGASVPVSVVSIDNDGARSEKDEAFFYLFVKPVISSFFPVNEHRINGLTTTTLTLIPKTLDTDIYRVTFSINNQEVSFDHSSSSMEAITYEWTPEYIGEHEILARVTDILGYRSDWIKRTYYVDQENEAPVVLSVHPENGTQITGLSPVSITLDVTDPDGSISSVIESTMSGNVSFEGISSPYTHEVTPDGYGEKKFFYQITDNQGLTTYFEHTLSFIAEVNEAPTVAIVTPSDQQVFQGLGAITLEAIAEDGDGEISKVTFKVDGQTIEDTSMPYAVSWNPSSAGTYSLEVYATDNQGKLSELQTRSFTVEVLTNDECSTTPAWINSQVYQSAGNKVKFEGKIYENKWYTKNDLPSNGGPWKLLKFCEAPAISCIGASAWSSTTAYPNAETEVVYQGSLYSNLFYSKNDIPGIDDAWELIGPCESAPSSFETITADIYPNPGSGILSLEINGVSPLLNKTTIEVRDIYGHILLKKAINYSSGSKIDIDMTGQQTGIYSLIINLEGQILSKTIQVN